jgi:sporulation protein YlmC with PRC-barrel domain
MRLMDLLGCEVRTESGHELQRVFDVRTEETEGGLRLVGLLVGRNGLFERLGFRNLRQMREQGEQTRPREEVIPWEAVLRIEKGILIVRDGTTLRRL